MRGAARREGLAAASALAATGDMYVPAEEPPVPARREPPLSANLG